MAKTEPLIVQAEERYSLNASWNSVTNFQPSDEEYGLLSRRSVAVSDPIARADQHSVLELRAPQERMKLQRPRGLHESVRISIVDVEPNSIHCVAALGHAEWPIDLAPDIFPVEPEFGMSFDLSVTEVNGIRRPVLRVAPDDPEAHGEIKAEIRQLIQQFD